MAFRGVEYGLAMQMGGRALPLDVPTRPPYELPFAAVNKIGIVVDAHMRAAGRHPREYGKPSNLPQGTEGAHARFNGIRVEVRRPEGADGTINANGYELRGIGPNGEVALRLTRESSRDPYTLSYAYADKGQELSGWSSGRPSRGTRRLALEYFRIAL